MYKLQTASETTNTSESLWTQTDYNNAKRSRHNQSAKTFDTEERGRGVCLHVHRYKHQDIPGMQC